MAKPKEVTKKVRKFSKNLKVELTYDELLAAGEELAKSLDIINDLDTELESIKKNFKSKITEETARVEQNQGKVRNKWDYREVDCEETTDKKTKTVKTVRLDTAEVIDSRKMTYNELQGKLFADDEKGKN